MRMNIKGRRKERFLAFPRFLHIIINIRYSSLTPTLGTLEIKRMRDDIFCYMKINKRGKKNYTGERPLIMFGRFVGDVDVIEDQGTPIAFVAEEHNIPDLGTQTGTTAEGHISEASLSSSEDFIAEKPPPTREERDLVYSQKMADLHFVPDHNMTTYLGDPPEKHSEFKSLIEGLILSPVHYAIMENPSIVADFIRGFWSTDEEHTDAHGAISNRYLAHVVTQCLSGRKRRYDVLNQILSSCLVALALGVDFNFSKMIFLDMHIKRMRDDIFCYMKMNKRGKKNYTGERPLIMFGRFVGDVDVKEDQGTPVAFVAEEHNIPDLAKPNLVIKIPARSPPSSSTIPILHTETPPSPPRTHSDKGKSPLHAESPYEPKGVPVNLESLQDRVFMLEKEAEEKDAKIRIMQDGMLKIADKLSKF
ncbi:hypothetical protein R6Q57_003537 [Mikania cordata]